jgi:hypothetical protein
MERKPTTRVNQSTLDYAKAVDIFSFIRYLHEQNFRGMAERKPKVIKLNKRCTIATVVFAEDQILLAETENDLQRNL